MAIRFYVGHGASGSAASMAGHVRGLVARGVDARAIDLPLKKAEAAVPVLPLDRARRSEGRPAPTARRSPSAASRTAGGSRASPRPSRTPTTPALVLFSFPLHPPGAPGRAEERTAHFPAIRCPVLFLSGEADPFARLDLLRAGSPASADAELVTYPRLGHTLKPVLDDALDRAAAFLLARLRSAGRRSDRRRQVRGRCILQCRVWTRPVCWAVPQGLRRSGGRAAESKTLPSESSPPRRARSTPGCLRRSLRPALVRPSLGALTVPSR